MNKPTITKVLIPAYKVTAETMRPNCKELCDMEEGCRPICQTESLQACVDDCAKDGGWSVREITKTFRTKKAAVKWASWIEFNNRRFPNVKKIFDEATAKDVIGAEWEAINKAWNEAVNEVSKIAKELFGVNI